MNWNEILMSVIPAAITLILGLFANNPKYVKLKKLMKLVIKALEDNKLTKNELEQIIKLFNSGDHSTVKSILDEKK